MAGALVEELDRVTTAEHVIEGGVAQVAIVDDSAQPDVKDGGLQHAELHCDVKVGH